MFAGRCSVGGVVSETVTVKLPLAEVLPAASFAVQLTVVVPSGKVEPEAGEHVTVGEGSMASVAVAVNVTTAPDALVAAAVMFPGTVQLPARVVSTVHVREGGVRIGSDGVDRPHGERVTAVSEAAERVRRGARGEGARRRGCTRTSPSRPSRRS